MGTYIVFILLIAVLLGYIIYLHFQLVKKNLFIESTVKRLSGMEKSWSAEEMKRFLMEVRKVQHYSSFFNDKLFEEKSLEFLLENKKDSKIYIHYTKEETVARSILTEGFRYTDSFYKTALPVTNDRLDLLMKHNSRKSFGHYLIIICLADRIIDHYTAELDRHGLKGVNVENILNETPVSKNENSDTVYLLPNRYVKGFINHQTGEIAVNPDFNPSYDSPAFARNIKFLNSNNYIV
ncbi:MAG: hypothetical protein NTW82_02595 [Bacteroidia bacterium]|nr:hypothetical protein [Bacteroidia bacterium]